MAKKTSRKELLKTEDAFTAAASHGAEWVSSNRNAVIASIVLVVAVSAGIWGAVSYVQTKQANASAALAAGMKVLAEPLTTNPEAAAEGDAPSFSTNEEKWQAAKVAFEKVIAEHGGSDASHLAQFYAGDLAEKLAAQDEAVRHFQALVRNLPKNNELYFLAVERLAYSLEAESKFDDAMALLERLGDKGFYVERALYHRARLHLRKGEPAKARPLLERIKADFSESSIIEDANELLGLVKTDASVDLAANDVAEADGQAEPDSEGREETP